jgi:hypothetical protein
VVTPNPEEMNDESLSKLMQERSHQRVSSFSVYSNWRTLSSLVVVAILMEMPPSELVRHDSVYEAPEAMVCISLAVLEVDQM